MHFPYSVSRGWKAKTSPVADEPQVTDPYPLAGIANQCWQTGTVQHTVVVITDIYAPPAVIFDLELDMDEHSASLRATDEVAVTSTGRSTLGEGDEVSFTARHLGWRFSMTSRITQYNRPYSFTDEQVRGPFAAMRHEHVFDVQPGGWTRMHDRFTVTAPLRSARTPGTEVGCRPVSAAPSRATRRAHQGPRRSRHAFHRVNTRSDAPQRVLTRQNLCSLSSSRTRHRSRAQPQPGSTDRPSTR